MSERRETGLAPGLGLLAHLDENVRTDLAPPLRRLMGHGTTTPEVGLTGVSDPVQLLHAATTQSILITIDKGYAHLQEAWIVWTTAWNLSIVHPGIIQLEHYRERDVERLARLIAAPFLARWRPTNELWWFNPLEGWRQYVGPRISDWTPLRPSPI